MRITAKLPTRKVTVLSLIASVLLACAVLQAVFSRTETSQPWKYPQVSFLSSNYVSSIGWRPNSRTLALVAAGGVETYSVEEGYRLLQGTVRDISYMAWNSDGSQLAGSGWDVWIWDPQTGLSLLAETVNHRIFPAVAWSPDDAMLATAVSGINRADNVIWIWDTQTKNLIQTIQDDSPLATQSSRGIFNDIEYGFSSVVWSPHGGMLISRSKQDDTIRIWDILTGQPETSFLSPTETTREAAFSPDEAMLAISSNNAIHIWDVANRQLMRTIQGDSQSVIAFVRWNPDDSRIASSQQDGTVIIWDAMTGLSTGQLRDQPRNIIAIEWNPGGDRLAIASEDGFRIWNVRTDEIDWYRIQRPRRYLAWSPDGLLLAVTIDEGTYIFDVSDE